MTDKEKYDFIDHVVHLTLFAEDRLLNEHGGEYSRLNEDGIDSNEYYRIITERVISILKKTKNYMQEEPVSEDKITISKEWFEHCKKSWYNEGYIDGEYNRDRQFEEPVSEGLEKAAKQYSFYIPTQCEATETWKKETEQHFKDGAKWQLAKIKSITLDDLEKFINELSKQFPEVSFAKVCKIATRTAKWQKEHLWKSADGDDLPEIDREVIALLDNGKVVFAHRPPEYWDGKDIITGKVTRNYVERYDKGLWNIPNVKYWLDCKLPKIEED